MYLQILQLSDDETWRDYSKLKFGVEIKLVYFNEIIVGNTITINSHVFNDLNNNGG